MKKFLYRKLARLMKKLAVSFYKRGLLEDFALPVIALHHSDEGIRLYRAGEYTRAFKLLKLVADIDSQSPDISQAQYTIGLMYYYGHGVSKDPITAERYLMLAAEKGRKEAEQYFLQKSERHLKH